jgi:hypothetical protein
MTAVPETPETPDFDQIAARLLRLVTDSMDPLWKTALAEVQRELVNVWNARGAADTVKIDTAMSSLLGVDKADPYIKTLDRALRTLDW